MRAGAALVLAFLAAAAHAYPGGLDTSFGGTGIVQTGIPLSSGQAAAFAVVLQSDGKIVVAGTAGSSSGANYALARYNPNGTLDTTFNANGTVTTAVTAGEDHGNAVAIAPDGKIVVAGGSFTSSFVWNFSVARYNTNGTLDTGFGVKTASIGSTYNEAYAVAVDGAGNIVMAGRAGDTPATDFGLLRYTSSGMLDPMFNGSGKVRTAMPFSCSGGCVGQAQALAIQSDGKILAGGWSGQLGNSDFVIVRYNSNGTIDTSFATGGVMRHALSSGNDQILALRIDSAGRIVAAGVTNPTGNKASYAVVRYLGNGAVDTTFGSNGVVITSISGGNDIAASIGFDSHGNIVVGGDENDVAGDFVVARYTANGILDNTFGCQTAGTCTGYVLTNFGGTDQGKGVVVQPDDNIVLVGASGAGTSTSKFAVVRYLGGGGSSGGGTGATQLAVTSVNGGNPVTAGSGFAVVAESRNAAGAPANVTSATQVSFALTTGTGPLSGTTSCTIAAGTSSCTASGLTLTTAQAGAVITASRVTGDALTSGGSTPFSVVSAAAVNILVTGFPSPSTAGSSNAFTVKARDAYNNVATGYLGTVHFTSTDAGAALPADYAFVVADGGQRTFSASLTTKGTWSITATDMGTSSITGTQTGLVVNPGAAATLSLVSGSGQNANVKTNYAFPLVANLKDAYGNVIAGQSVTFSSPLSDAGAVFAGGGSSLNAVTDANGNASTGTFAANAVGGNYAVTGSYPALVPVTFSLTNNKVNSTTTVGLTSGTSPAAVNTSLTFTATVSGSAGTATGTVNFVVDGATTLCANVGLNAAGQASCTTQSLAGGTRLITAQYTGSGSYNGSNSSALSQSMTKTAPAVAITGASPNPSAVNAAVTVAYTVTPSPSGPVVPSGNVTVSDGTASCTGTVAAGQCAITFASSGTKTLTASYAGDASFNAATSAGFSQTVSSGTATVALGANPSSATVGTTSTITATVSGSQGTPTGTVAVSGAGGNCSITLANGTGSCNLPTNTVGATQTVTGSYSGNATYGTATGTTTLSVTKATPNVALSANPASVGLGQTTTVTATVSGNAGTPAGSVVVGGSGASCTVTLVNGTGTCALTANSAGSNETVTGNYSGDAKYNAGSGTTSLTVNKATPSVTLAANPTAIGVGGTTTITATVASGAGTPSGTVAVSGAGGSCTVTLASGTGTCTLSGATAGTNQTVTGNYSGDANFNTASGTTTLTVNTTNASVALSANPTSVTIGSASTITATVSGSSGTPTGTVSVSGAGGNCTITLSAGTGSCSLPTSTAGTGQTITGNYGGNATYGASSGTTTLTVNKALAVVAVGVNPSTITIGQATTVTANVSGGVGTPTGIVTVSGGGGSCAITLANGTGTCTLAPNTTGSGIVVTGSYGGDAKYANGSGTTSLTVNKITPNVAVSVNPNSTSMGTAVLASATVSGTSGIPTGTVSVSGAGGACTISLANGGGSCQLTPTTAGNGQVVSGSYSGDGSYASRMATTTLSVNGGVGSGPSLLDVDLSGMVDALTDGMLIERYLLGLSGPSLTLNALSPDAQRTNPAQIVAYLDSIDAELDVDGDGNSDALTDGIIIMRYLFGIRGNALIQNAVSPTATRTTAAEIEAYIQSLLQ